MLDSSSDSRLPAPCIVDIGTIVNKRDMQRILSDLDRVRYVYIQEGKPQSRGEGRVMEVFADPGQLTAIANQSIYINVCSFDYLELRQGPKSEAIFDLIEGDRQLRLTPVSTPIKPTPTTIEPDALEAVLARVISAKLDAQIDAQLDAQMDEDGTVW